MMNNFYKNPLTKIYQYEYAVYTLLTGYFKSTECNSRAIESLRIYYSELVSVSATGKCSYEKQYELEEKCETLVQKCILPKISMPGANLRHVKIYISPNQDKTHTFTFKSGEYYFSYRFVLEEIKPKEVIVKSTEEGRDKPKAVPSKSYKVFLKVMNVKKPETPVKITEK